MRIRDWGGRRGFVAVLIVLAFGVAGTLALVRDSSEGATSKRQLTSKGTRGIAGAGPVVNFKRLALDGADEGGPPVLGKERDALPPRWEQRQTLLEGLQADPGTDAP